MEGKCAYRFRTRRDGDASKAPALIERRSSYLYHVCECELFRKFARIEGSIPDLYHGIRDARDVQTMAESEGVIPDLHQSVGKDCTLKGPARVESMTSYHTDAVWENDTFEGTTVGVHIFRYLHSAIRNDCSTVLVNKVIPAYLFFCLMFSFFNISIALATPVVALSLIWMTLSSLSMGVSSGSTT